MEKLLKDNAAKISESVQASIKKVKQAASGEDAAAIHEAVKQLQQASHTRALHRAAVAGRSRGTNDELLANPG